jgi:membrane dipeptidase
MLVIDGHLDLAWNALQFNRDLQRSCDTIRALEGQTPGPGRAQNTVALPEMRQGRIALCFATLLARCTGTAAAHIDYPSASQAYAIAQGQLAYYGILGEAGAIRMISDLAGLDHHMAEWSSWEAAGDADGETPPPGLVISMESADPIWLPEQLPAWRQAGVRLIGPAHYGPGRYAGGTGTELGLSDLGGPLLDGMADLGILLDVTHLSDQAFWQALSRYDGPILASHNNCRALVPHQRQFTDQQLRAIFQRDGVIGAAFDAWMLQPGWIQGQSSNETVSLSDVVDHIDHVCQLAGNSRHAAIGSDLDGGFGREQSPHDLKTIADLQELPALLANRGYGQSDIAAIMHGNWLRLLRNSWQS